MNQPLPIPPAFRALPDDPLPDTAPTITPAAAPAAAAPAAAAPAAAEPGSPPATEMLSERLGLLGPPASGKTTFLAALRFAAEQYHQSGWMLYGDNDEAQVFLKENTDRMRRQRGFPGATMDLQPSMRFVLRGPRMKRERRGLRTRRREVATGIKLDILDAPGGFYGWHNQQPADPSEESDLGSGAAPSAGGGDDDQTRLASHLGESAGLILLVDPVLADNPDYDAYDYLQSVVLDIARQSADRSTDRYLPQYLAVCLTKCDHPNVFGRARASGLVIDGAGQNGFPQLSERMARDYFTTLCEGGARGRAGELQAVIRQYFSPRRTRFFMTSAVGFRRDPQTGGFEPADPMNVEYETGLDGENRSWVAGQIQPVNVLEPVLWLAGTQVRKHS